MEKALISVIVPVYNGETCLSGCIESIEKQTYRNLEIIIINDGSTDGTGRVCEQLQETYDNISVITTNDDGVSVARNTGLQAAAGDYVTFVDADDRLHDRMLDVLYEGIVKTASDMAGCRFFTWESEAQWQEHAVGKDGGQAGVEWRTYTPDTYVRNAVLQGNSRCWSKLYKKEALAHVRFRRELSIGEDLLFVLDVLSGAGKVAESAYPGYGYFQNPNGAMNRRFSPRYMDQITCWEIARDKIREIDGKEDLYVQATTLLIMGIMLTAGKIAGLPACGRRENSRYTGICHSRLKQALCVPGAYAGLSTGYKIKTGLFAHMPALYLFLYHIKEAGKRDR
ncbi:MAG: glycosyltransferase [Ruminococcus sp.]|nr:glycosyltransferase [Ruminococcus sp.]